MRILQVELKQFNIKYLVSNDVSLKMEFTSNLTPENPVKSDELRALLGEPLILEIHVDKRNEWYLLYGR